MTLVVPHPHDVLFAKLERWESGDREHARLILRAFPLTREALAELDRQSPYNTGQIVDERRVTAYRRHLMAFQEDVGLV